MIVESYAITNPWTMMIHSSHTKST